MGGVGPLCVVLVRFTFLFLKAKRAPFGKADSLDPGAEMRAAFIIAVSLTSVSAHPNCESAAIVDASGIFALPNEPGQQWLRLDGVRVGQVLAIDACGEGIHGATNLSFFRGECGVLEWVDDAHLDCAAGLRRRLLEVGHTQPYYVELSTAPCRGHKQAPLSGQYFHLVEAASAFDASLDKATATPAGLWQDERLHAAPPAAPISSAIPDAGPGRQLTLSDTAASDNASAVDSVDELRWLLSRPGEQLIHLLNGSRFDLGGEALNVSGEATIEGGGALLDAGYASRVLEVSGRLTLRNATLARGYASSRGGCILVGSGQGEGELQTPRLVLEGTSVEDCAAGSGGGIAVVDGEVEVVESSVSRCVANNSESAFGGGVLLVNGSVALVSSDVSDCNATDGLETVSRAHRLITVGGSGGSGARFVHGMRWQVRVRSRGSGVLPCGDALLFLLCGDTNTACSCRVEIHC